MLDILSYSFYTFVYRLAFFLIDNRVIDMEDVTGIDISLAKLKHKRWCLLLDSFLKGKESLSDVLSNEEVNSHRDCDLGKWLYSVGLEKYSSTPEIKELERVHENIHTLIRKVAQLKNAGNSTAAETELQKMKAVSDDIIGLLDRIDLT